MSTNVFVYSEPSDKLDLATLAQCELQVDEFLGSPVSRNEPMLMGSPAAPTATAYSVDVEKVFCDGVLAIMRIASSKLFRFAEPLPFTGLESYFRARFSLSRAQVYRYLNCAAVISDLLCAPQHMTPMLRPLPLRQRVAKAVKDLAPCRTSRQQLWAAVLAQQPAGLDITSTDVQRVAALLQQEAVRGNHPHSLPPQVQPPSVTAVADTPCLAPTMVPKPAACRALAANYPSPPSETFHSMDDTDDHGDFSGMDAGHFGPGGDVSHDSQILYPDPTLPAAGGDEDVIPLVYPSPDIPHVTRVQDAVSPLHCLAHVAVTSSSFSPSMLSTKSDPTSEIPLSGPIPPTPNSGSLSQPALPHQLATAAPPTRISLISSSQAYRTTQASLRGPALGIMSPDLRPMTLRPESPVLGQSIAPSFGFDHAPACTNQWNCQLPPVRHLIAMVDQSTVKAQRR